MARFLFLCGALAAVTPVGAVTEFRLGGTDGNAWETTLSTEGIGEYVILDASGSVLQRVPVAATPHGAGTDTLIDFSGHSIQPRLIDPSVNMVLVDPASDARRSVPFYYTGGNAAPTNLGPCTNLAIENEIIRRMFDGDPATAMFRGFSQNPERPPGYGEGFGQLGSPKSVVIDLGAAVPVNRIRFYPRLGRREDRLLIEELEDPRPSLEGFGEDSFAENYLAWYELRVADDTPVFRQGPCDAVGVAQGLPWVQPSDSQLNVLKDARENLDVVVDLRIPTQSIRWLNLRPLPLRNWEIAEFEVYGEGYVEHSSLTTQILDFGRPINWGKIRWRGERPEGARLEIRTRTGATADPNIYQSENTNGDLQPISLAEYNRIDVSGRLPPTYDLDNWSFWSPPYEFAAGLRDESQPALAWTDGTPLVSPGPSRYLQISIRLFGSFVAAPRLDQLVVQMATAPSAQEVVGEIWPVEVVSFEPTLFTNVVRPVFEEGNIGFDRLEIFTASRVDTLISVKVDGRKIDLDTYPVVVLDDRLIAAFPPLGEQEDSFKQVEVVFRSSVLRFGTEFLGWVYNSGHVDRIKQRVEPGNATFRYSGDVLAVRTPLGGDLLLHVGVEPNPFSPNDDGVNDTAQFAYRLRQVTAERPLTLSIYALSGDLVLQLPVTLATSGEFSEMWDGRDRHGQLVPPGVYLYALTLEASWRETHVGSIAVAY